MYGTIFKTRQNTVELSLSPPLYSDHFKKYEAEFYICLETLSKGNTLLRNLLPSLLECSF